jgi:hypothetical protein
VFAVAARDRGALDIAPFFAKNLPEPIQRRLAGADRSARDELAFVAGQIKRLGMAPTALHTRTRKASAGDHMRRSGFAR